MAIVQDSQLNAPAISFLSSVSPPANPSLDDMTLNTTAAFFAGQAFWGPVTATLDWCEVSILHSTGFLRGPTSVATTTRIELIAFLAFRVQ